MASSICCPALDRSWRHPFSTIPISAAYILPAPPKFSRPYSAPSAWISAVTAPTPAFVGETGGKDFVFAHASADVEALVAAIMRGGFEFQGQKCSAASRVYIPDTLWPQARERLLDEIATIRMGDVCDFGNFMNAVIRPERFRKNFRLYRTCQGQQRSPYPLRRHLRRPARGSLSSRRWPKAKTPRSRLMCEEIFGPGGYGSCLSGKRV